MNRWITISCAALFAATNLCSLVLSASSTLAKAEAVGVPRGAMWSAVGVLELVSLAGTLRWLTATTRRGRLHAIGVVGLVALVTGVAGWAAYGWFGLVAPLAVIATLHMIVETLNDLAARPGVVVEAEPQPEPELETEPVEVQTEPVRPQLRSVGWSVEEIVADLRGTDPNQRGLQRHIRDHYNVGPGKATKVIAGLLPQEEAS